MCHRSARPDGGPASALPRGGRVCPTFPRGGVGATAGGGYGDGAPHGHNQFQRPARLHDAAQQLPHRSGRGGTIGSPHVRRLPVPPLGQPVRGGDPSCHARNGGQSPRGPAAGSPGRSRHAGALLPRIPPCYHAARIRRHGRGVANGGTDHRRGTHRIRQCLITLYLHNLAGATTAAPALAIRRLSRLSVRLTVIGHHVAHFLAVLPVQKGAVNTLVKLVVRGSHNGQRLRVVICKGQVEIFIHFCLESVIHGERSFLGSFAASIPGSVDESDSFPLLCKCLGKTFVFLVTVRHGHPAALLPLHFLKPAKIVLPFLLFCLPARRCFLHRVLPAPVPLQLFLQHERKVIVIHFIIRHVQVIVVQGHRTGLLFQTLQFQLRLERPLLLRFLFQSLFLALLS
mmetsp:Transcript_35625/g.100309  ORF Transcript_35625/g.100309 Transcript_35625/m.100309 type:complete len:399 (-) Transcript_35625:517-1713(-)